MEKVGNGGWFWVGKGWFWGRRKAGFGWRGKGEGRDRRTGAFTGIEPARKNFFGFPPTTCVWSVGKKEGNGLDEEPGYCAPTAKIVGCQRTGGGRCWALEG